MQAFSLPILFVSILLVVAWGFIDNARTDREGAKRRKLEQLEAQAHMAQSVRKALRSRR